MTTTLTPVALEGLVQHARDTRDPRVLIEAIPHTATGKILKTALRDQFKDYRFPNAAA